METDTVPKSIARPVAADDFVESDFDQTLEPGRMEKHYWRDIWRYRELFYILAKRDISIRYKQTVIGIAWALIQPVTSMIIMTVIFSRVAGLHSDGNTPYALMVFAATMPWMFFSTALSSSSGSMVSNANLISKVYFPRLIIPASTVVTSFADLMIQMLILGAMMAWFEVMPTWHMLFLPFFIVMAFFTILGPGLFLTALNVKYRDMRYVIPFMIQIGMYLSPVGYSSSMVYDKFGPSLFLLYSLNPLVGIIDGFRWAILGNQAPLHWEGLCVSASVTAFFLFLGISYFRKTEKSYVDII
jgi:lipopolysaccharide transport system permease protein